ncbi:MAG: flagellar hook-length control protein FliK, partial [Pseudomonadota bacterium]
PLLVQAPRSGADLAPVLSKAIAQSGLFYEAHQARWVSGKLPLANLLHEPQGRLSAPQAQVAAEANKLMLASLRRELQGQIASQTLVPQRVLVPQRAETAAQAGAQPQVGLQQEPQGQLTSAQAQVLAQANKLLQTGILPAPQEQPPLPTPVDAKAGGDAAAAARPNIKDMPAPQPAAAVVLNRAAGREETTEGQRLPAGLPAHLTQGLQSVPEELRLLVQQQLDAAGTQRLFWHGEVWPGQTMQWRVEWAGENGNEAGQNDPEPWSTTLRLTTPLLGEVEAALRLGASGVRISLTTLHPPSVAILRDGTAELAQALEAAGVPLRGLTVKFVQDPGKNNPE